MVMTACLPGVCNPRDDLQSAIQHAAMHPLALSMSKPEIHHCMGKRMSGARHDWGSHIHRNTALL